MEETLTTYIINLTERVDRKKAILNEFAQRGEFDVHFFSAHREQRGAWGLWKSIVDIVEKAKSDDLDVVLICEDDHMFTYSYDCKSFCDDVRLAANLGCEIMLGGIGNYNNLVPVNSRLMWVDWFWCTQFMVIFNGAFDKILNAQFDKDKDVADEFLSQLFSNKLVVYPFISRQCETGYSDVTASNNLRGTMTSYFDMTDHRIKSYLRVLKKYGLWNQYDANHVKHYPPNSYLDSAEEPKLHIGCGTFIKDGWLNVDLNPHYGAEFMDASQEFPFPDESFNYVYSEHLLEHLSYLGGKNFLSESFRVLKTGGVLRIALPDLEFLIRLYQNPDHRAHRQYINWSINQYTRWMEDDFVNRTVPACYVLNHYMHAWGHQMVYDKEMLQCMLEGAGFAQCSFKEIGISDYPALKGVEDHGKMIPEWANRLETMVVEAIKIDKNDR